MHTMPVPAVRFIRGLRWGQNRILRIRGRLPGDRVCAAYALLHPESLRVDSLTRFALYVLWRIWQQMYYLCLSPYVSVAAEGSD